MAYEIDPKEVEKGMAIVNRLGLLDRANPSLGKTCVSIHSLFLPKFGLAIPLPLKSGV